MKDLYRFNAVRASLFKPTRHHVSCQSTISGNLFDSRRLRWRYRFCGAKNLSIRCARRVEARHIDQIDKMKRSETKREFQVLSNIPEVSEIVNLAPQLESLGFIGLNARLVEQLMRYVSFSQIDKVEQ